MLSYLSFVIGYLTQQPPVSPLYITHDNTARLLERLNTMGVTCSEFQTSSFALSRESKARI